MAALLQQIHIPTALLAATWPKVLHAQLLAPVLGVMVVSPLLRRLTCLRVCGGLR
jgi:hypothetical protein